MKRYIVLLIFILVSITGCQKAETLVDKADATIRGTVFPGIALGKSGPIYVVVSRENDPEKINWNINKDVLSTFGEYEINDLVGGKYYITSHLDINRNEQRDSNEPWGGYDGNGDGRLDQVQLLGGKTLDLDVTFFDVYE